MTFVSLKVCRIVVLWTLLLTVPTPAVRSCWFLFLLTQNGSPSHDFQNLSFWTLCLICLISLQSVLLSPFPPPPFLPFQLGSMLLYTTLPFWCPRPGSQHLWLPGYSWSRYFRGRGELFVFWKNFPWRSLLPFARLAVSACLCNQSISCGEAVGEKAPQDLFMTMKA